MSILTLLLIAMVVWMFLSFYNYKSSSHKDVLKKISYGRSIGLFALVFGIFAHLIGFYHAFARLEEVSHIAPSVLYAGLKVSLITTIYGVLIYLISLLLWFVFSAIVMKRASRLS